MNTHTAACQKPAPQPRFAKPLAQNLKPLKEFCGEALFVSSKLFLVIAFAFLCYLKFASTLRTPDIHETGVMSDLRFHASIAPTLQNIALYAKAKYLNGGITTDLVADLRERALLNPSLENVDLYVKAQNEFNAHEAVLNERVSSMKIISPKLKDDYDEIIQAERYTKDAIYFGR